MFDIGFTELLLISVIALVILGPDRLPGAIRTLGLWIGRLRRSFNNIKADIEREVGADEIRRQLRNEAIVEKIRKTKAHINQNLDSVMKEADAVKKDLSMEEEFKGLSGQGKKEKESSDTPPPQSPSPASAGENEPAAVTQSPAHKVPRAPRPAESTPPREPSSESTASGNSDSVPGNQEKPPEQK